MNCFFSVRNKETALEIGHRWMKILSNLLFGQGENEN